MNLPMKRIYKQASAILATVLLISCGGGGNKMEELDLFPVKSGDTYQYVNRKGEIVINPQFDEAAVFSDGLALVQTSGDNRMWGYIDDEGKYVINAQYKEATSFSEGLAWVVEKDKAPAAINKKGEVKFTLQQAEKVYSFSEGLASFSTINDKGEQLCGFVDKNGEVKISPQFDAVLAFSDGLSAFRNEERKWGFMDKEGKVVINPQFDEANIFVNGFACVALGDKWGVIDKKGEYSINPQFESIAPDGDWFLITQGSKYGWCNREGMITINPQFKYAYSFGNNKLTAVSSGDDFGFIDKEGKFVINPQFQFAMPFNGDLALVYSNSRMGFIDKEGKYIVNPQFDNISEDLRVYLYDGRSEYDKVDTDFFDVNAVISVLNFDSPEGFTAQSTFNDVKAKYALEESNFSRTNTEHHIITSKSIAKNTYLDFYVWGPAYDAHRVQNGSGWFTYYNTEYVFNGSNKPTSYSYKINNYGDKEESIKEAIDAKLTSLGYELNVHDDVYEKEGKAVDVSQDDNSIFVYIAFEGETTNTNSNRQ
jgi:hypothetical protein